MVIYKANLRENHPIPILVIRVPSHGEIPKAAGDEIRMWGGPVVDLSSIRTFALTTINSSQNESHNVEPPWKYRSSTPTRRQVINWDTPTQFRWVTVVQKLSRMCVGCMGTRRSIRHSESVDWGSGTARCGRGNKVVGIALSLIGTEAFGNLNLACPGAFV